MFRTLLIAGAFDASSGDDGIQPAFGTISGVPAERTVQPSSTPSTPSTSSTGLGTSYATLFKAPMSPGDRLDWVIDFSGLLGLADAIATIEAISLNAAAAALGISIDADADRKPMVDTAAGKVRICISCSPPNGSTAFQGSGIPAGILLRIRTAGTPTRAYECTVAIMVRQL